MNTASATLIWPRSRKLKVSFACAASLSNVPAVSVSPIMFSADEEEEIRGMWRNLDLNLIPEALNLHVVQKRTGGTTGRVLYNTENVTEVLREIYEGDTRASEATVPYSNRTVPEEAEKAAKGEYGERDVSGFDVVVDGEKDTVIPVGVIEKICESAVSAKELKRCTVAGAPHFVFTYLRKENLSALEGLMKQIVDMLKR